MTKVPSPRSSSSGSVEKRADIDAFLNKVRETPRSDGSQAGLIFALDATMSRQATWDQAMNVQSAMFDAVGVLHQEINQIGENSLISSIRVKNSNFIDLEIPYSDTESMSSHIYF